MDNNGEAFATVLILSYDEFNDSVSDVHHTLRAGTKQSTGVLIIENSRRDGARISENITPTLQSFMGTGGGNVPMIFPIDDGRELEKHQNGTGIGDEGSPAYTLDRQQLPAVVVAPTLSASNNPSRSPQSSEITAQVDAMVRETGIVRRLTPRECERLQGFPDDWTDGQADSNRYKQMGNAVAVPVVQWIVDRMVAND